MGLEDLLGKRLRVNDAVLYQRKILHLKSGAGVTLTPTDNNLTGETEVLIEAQNTSGDGTLTTVLAAGNTIQSGSIKKILYEVRARGDESIFNTSCKWDGPPACGFDCIHFAKCVSFSVRAARRGVFSGVLY